MNKFVLLIFTGILAFSVEGCSYLAEFTDARKQLETETKKPTSIKVNASADKSQAKEEINEEDEVETAASSEAQPLQKIAGLIPTTNPETRVRGSVRGRQDPFSVVTLQPTIEIPPPEEKPGVEPRPSRSVSPVNRTNVRNTRPTRNVNRIPRSRPTPSNPTIPSLAKDVLITGVIELGGRPKIIVQAPEEASSRYVEVGEYLSNGQVLVKRIDINHFPTPRIILEQSGIEVAKTIGSESEETKVSSSPTTDTLTSSINDIAKKR